MAKAKQSPEAQEALKTLETAERLNSAFIKDEAGGVRTLANRLATLQFPTTGFEDFYRDLSKTVGLEPQVVAIILSMANEMRRSREHTLATIEERQVGREIKEALRKPRSSPDQDDGGFAEGPLPGQDPFREDFGDGRSRRLPIEVE
ncbi:MAG: hypothetical protein AAB739_01990 [Patescibacteria group bacterium]